jgi:hypothetical protein
MHSSLDDFERACIQLMVRGGLLESDVNRHLPFVRVADRIHDRDGRHTRFHVEPDAPLIVPRDAALSADFVIAEVGTVTVDLNIVDGFMLLLWADYPPDGWPPHPQIAGFAEYPES